MSATRKTVLIVAGAILLVAALWMWQGETSLEPQLRDESDSTPELSVAPLPGPDALAPDSVRAQAPLPAANEPSPPRPDPRFGSLRLHVVWAEDRTPAGGVHLRLYQRGADDPYRDTLEACTDEAGEVWAERVFAGPVAVKFDRGSQALVDVAAGRENSATLEIPEGFSVCGMVIDIDARPFAGAAIYVQIFGAAHEGFVVAHSATDGSFAIRSLRPRTSVSISALAVGRTPTRQHVVMGERGATSTLRLCFESQGGALSGRVLAPGGAPIAAARVLVGSEFDSTPVALGDGSFGRPPPSQLAYTNDRGEFAMDGIAEGVQALRARAGGFAPWKGEVEIVAGRNVAKDVFLSVGASLSGVVRDQQGSPLTGVEVWANSGVSFASSFRRTLSDGSFAMRDLPLGEIAITADGGDRGHAETALFAVAGRELRWDPVLSSGASLRVQLIAAGRDLAGWRITAEAQPALIDAYVDTRTTGADGRIEFANVPDVELRVSLRAPGPHSFPRAVLHGVRARDGDIVIQPDPALEPTVYLRGRVVDPDGKPIGGVRVQPISPLLFYPPSAVADGTTGSFEFGPLPAGDWSVHGFVPGFARLRSASARVDAGVTWDFGDLRMERGGTVVAKLAFEGAALDAQLVVELRDSAGELEALVVKDQLANSGLVPAGHYTLIARGPGFATSELELDVQAEQATQVTLALRRN